jgi:hypothetical protein
MKFKNYPNCPCSPSFKKIWIRPWSYMTKLPLSPCKVNRNPIPIKLCIIPDYILQDGTKSRLIEIKVNVKSRKMNVYLAVFLGDHVPLWVAWVAWVMLR